MTADVPTFDPRDRQEWHAWLEKHHATERMIWIVHHKRHTARANITYRDALDEAICFGWIDTVVRRLDDERYLRCFRRRTPNARWSNNTLAYARRLIREGRMTPAGKKAYLLGRAKPTIDSGVGHDPDTPPALKRAMRAAGVEKEFKKLARSYRRHYISWLSRAKRPETQEKRIREIVGRIRAGKRPNDP